MPALNSCVQLCWLSFAEAVYDQQHTNPTVLDIHMAAKHTCHVVALMTDALCW